MIARFQSEDRNNLGMSTSAGGVVGIVVSEITSSWEDGPDGLPVLFCRTTTKGKPDVCDQRSTIEMSPGGATKLRVETRLTKKPGAETVEYDRVYTRVNEAAVVESRA